MKARGKKKGAHGGKRKGSGRKPKYAGGTRWVQLAVPETLAKAIEAQGHQLAPHLLQLLTAAHKSQAARNERGMDGA